MGHVQTLPTLVLLAADGTTLARIESVPGTPAELRDTIVAAAAKLGARE